MSQSSISVPDEVPQIDQRERPATQTARAQPSPDKAGVDDRVVIKFIDALTGNQAYLLIFGVSVLAFGGGGTVGIIGMTQGDRSLLVGGLTVTALTLLAAVSVIWMSQRNTKTAHIGGPNVGNRDFEQESLAMYSNLQTALTRVHPVFQKFIFEICQDFRRLTAEWADGQIKARNRAYSDLTLMTYRQATKQIFATSAPDYLEVWQKPGLGQAVLKAQQESKCKDMTRVFIFNKREDITEDAINLMKRHAADGRAQVRVSVYNEWIRGIFPDNISWNLLFVDEGEIICSTEKVTDGGTLVGTWHFKDQDVVGPYKNIIADLMDDTESASLDDIISAQRGLVR